MPEKWTAYHVRKLVVGHLVALILAVVLLDLGVSLGKEFLTFCGLLGTAVLLTVLRLHGSHSMASNLNVGS